MNKKEAEQRIKKLREEIWRLNRAYFIENRTEVSEDVRDALKQELITLEEKFPDLITFDSPTQRVGAPLDGRLPKVAHLYPKESLLDAFSEEDLTEWLDQMRRALGKERAQFELVCELKIDGLNVSLVYEKKPNDDSYLLKRAVTRGNGVEGEDVTHTVRTIEAVPLRLFPKIPRGAIPSRYLEISGEVYMSKASLKKLNAKLPESERFANCRNAAAGSVRQLDPKVAAERDLRMFCYALDTKSADELNLSTQKAILEFLHEVGVPTNRDWKIVHDVAAAQRFYEAVHRKREPLPQDIDGLVLKVNDRRTQRDLGSTAKAPRWARAYKFPAEQKTARILDIRLQVGRTGAITPVAMLTPTLILGTTVTRATLHNEDEIRRLDVRIGDTVIVQKAGDVIPEVTQVLKNLRRRGAKPFQYSRNCPSCGTKLLRPEGEVVHRCPNSKCGAARQERVEHFVSRYAFNIEGLGGETIEALLGEGLISDPADIFTLTHEDVMQLPLYKEKKTENVLQSIEVRKRIPIERFLFALGIRHIGRETAEILARRISWPTRLLSVREQERLGKQSSLFGGLLARKVKVRGISIRDIGKTLASTKEEDLAAIDGIGEVSAESLLEWVRDDDNHHLLAKLEDAGVICVQPEGSAALQIFTGKIFVLTGTLPTVSREEARQMIKDRGGKVSSSVSKKTDYVLLGADPGSKHDDAKRLGINIIDEKEFLRMCKAKEKT